VSTPAGPRQRGVSPGHRHSLLSCSQGAESRPSPEGLQGEHCGVLRCAMAPHPATPHPRPPERRKP